MTDQTEDTEKEDNVPSADQHQTNTSDNGVSSASHQLSIISFGHSNGPLKIEDNPGAEVLIFSVRNVTNPPAKLRRTHTGLSARLRKEVMADRDAAARLDEIYNGVQERIAELLGPGQDKKDESNLHLIVGIMCEEGKHRSVTFAVELSHKLTGLKDWEVRVCHRDLGGLESTTVPVAGEDGASRPTATGAPRTSARRKRERAQGRKKGRSEAGKFVGQGPNNQDSD